MLGFNFIDALRRLLDEIENEDQQRQSEQPSVKTQSSWIISDISQFGFNNDNDNISRKINKCEFSNDDMAKNGGARSNSLSDGFTTSSCSTSASFNEDTSRPTSSTSNQQQQTKERHKEVMSFLVPPTTSKSQIKRKVELYSENRTKGDISDELKLQTEEGAKEFLDKKYFESLYFMRIPLYYFPKTLISRLESIYLHDENKSKQVNEDNVSSQHDKLGICELPKKRKPNLNKEEMKRIINQAIIDVEDFDQRHNNTNSGEDNSNSKFGGILSSPFFSNYEEKYRSNFTKLNQLDYLQELKSRKQFVDNERFQKVERTVHKILENFLFYLKIRETQLQVLLIIEYLYLDITDIPNSNNLLEENEAISSKAILQRDRSSENTNSNSSNEATGSGIIFNGVGRRSTLIRPRKKLKKSKSAVTVETKATAMGKDTKGGTGATASKNNNITSTTKIANYHHHQQQQPKPNVFYRRLLNTYLDRLLIWDIILETKTQAKKTTKGQPSPEKTTMTAEIEDLTLLSQNEIKKTELPAAGIESIGENVFDNELIFSTHFIKKVVIPFFYYKCPHLIKFIRKKVSGDLTKSSRHRHSKGKIKNSGKKSDSPVPSSVAVSGQSKSVGEDRLSLQSPQSKKSLYRAKTVADFESRLTSSSNKLQTSSLRAKSMAHRYGVEAHKEINGGSNGVARTNNNKTVKRAASATSFQNSKLTQLLGKREVDFTFGKKSHSQKLKNSTAEAAGKSLKKAKSLVDTSSMLAVNKSSKGAVVGKSFSQIEATPVKNLANNPHLSFNLNNLKQNSLGRGGGSSNHNSNRSGHKSLKRQLSELSTIESSPNVDHNISPSIIASSPSSSVRVISASKNDDNYYNTFSTPGKQFRGRDKIMSEEINSAELSRIIEETPVSTIKQTPADFSTTATTSFLADLNGSPKNSFRSKSMAEEEANVLGSDSDGDSMILDLTSDEDEESKRFRRQIFRK